MIKDRIKEALIPAFLTLAVFMGVLFAKGIYPFGGLRIDYYDMGQTNAPLYYHIWDFLHGRGGLFYSWYIDEGQNLAMGSSIQWNISVFNLFFLFIKRSAVMKSLSIFMGLHLFFMAFNMNLLIRHTTAAPKFFRVLFGIAYGLTGFTLTHYTIPTYLDTAALMPLYLITLYDVLSDRSAISSDFPVGIAGAVSERPEPDGEKTKSEGTVKLSKTGSIVIYALMTGYMTGLGYYMAFMNLIFVLLVSGTYIFILCGTGCEKTASGKVLTALDEVKNPVSKRAWDKETRKHAVGRAAVRLGIGTFAGIGFSAFMLIPAAMQMRKSSRFNSNLSGGFPETIHDILWAIGADMYYIKWWLLSGSIVAIVMLLSGFVHFRKERRQAVFFFLFCMYPCALIVFESINLLWHMGTYYHYPIRCGYLIPITLLVTAAYYAGRFETERYVNQEESKSTAHFNKPSIAAFSIASVAAGILLIIYYVSHAVWQVEELFRTWVVFALILAVIYALILCVIKRPAYIAPVLIAELFVTAYIGYGTPHFVDRFSSDPEQSGDYVITAQELADSLDITESRTDRIKNPDTTLNTNYGFIMKRATVGGWANTVPGSQMDSAIALGYGAHFMRILDCGGTLLSDAALHVTETLTLKPEIYLMEVSPDGETPMSQGAATGSPDQRSGAERQPWEKIADSGEYTLLKNKYTLPFAMQVDSNLLKVDNTGADIGQMNVEDATNTLYSWLSGSQEAATGKDVQEDDGGIMKDITGKISCGEYYVNQRKAFYLREGSFDKLTINGRVIPIPDIGDPNGTSYPAWFNSGVIFLGIYENEDIKIEGVGDPDTRFYELDLDKLEKLCDSYAGDNQEITAGRSSLDMTIDGKSGETALIPMAFDTGFAASVNGEKAEVMNVSNLFMGIPLTDGINNIRLSFTPDGLIPGIVISVAFLLLIIFFALRPVSTVKIESAGAVILALLWGAFVIVLYLIPYIAFVIHQIQKRWL